MFREIFFINDVDQFGPVHKDVVIGTVIDLDYFNELGLAMVPGQDDHSLLQHHWILLRDLNIRGVRPFN